MSVVVIRGFINNSSKLILKHESIILYVINIYINNINILYTGHEVSTYN